MTTTLGKSFHVSNEHICFFGGGVLERGSDGDENVLELDSDSVVQLWAKH